MSLSLLLLGLATIPGAVAPAGIHSTLRRTCVGNACAGITDPRAFVDKVRGIFSAQRSSTTAAHSFSPAGRPARMATALVAEASRWSAWESTIHHHPQLPAAQWDHGTDQLPRQGRLDPRGPGLATTDHSVNLTKVAPPLREPHLGSEPYCRRVNLTSTVCRPGRPPTDPFPTAAECTTTTDTAATCTTTTAALVAAAA
jgi:hypothetical protein